MPSSTNLYWQLRLNYHAALLSLRPPHNTLQLQTTPYTEFGEIWDSEATTLIRADSVLAASPAKFVSRDSSKVLVSSTGLVTARAVQTGNVYVVATRKLGNTTHTDSALIRVAEVMLQPIIDTFRVRPRDGDSAKVASGYSFFGTPNTKVFVVTAKDSTGASIANIPIYFTSSNPLLAKVTNAFVATKSITAIQPGEVVLRAETWVYGVAKQDTMVFTVGYPIAPTIIIYSAGMTRDNLEWHYGPGATIGFNNFTGMTAGQASKSGGVAQNGVPIDIIFDDSIHVLAAIPSYQNSGDGNIREIPGDTMSSDDTRYRRFITPGTYVYRTLPLNTTGRIIIHDK